MFYRSADQFKELSGYEIDGFWYPRVTKIIDIKSKPALNYYYAAAADYKTAQAQTKISAEEGTRVHSAVEKIFTGEKPDDDPSIAPSINAFQEFLETKNIQVAPEHVEKRVVHYDHRYAGTLDALALIDGRFGVLDVKTSQAIYRDYNIQTSAYMGALHEEFPNLQTRWILRIDQVKTCKNCSATLRTKGGRDKIRAVKVGGKLCADEKHDWGNMKGVVELKEFPFWHGDFEAFLAAKKLWEWENEFWLKKIGYL